MSRDGGMLSRREVKKVRFPRVKPSLALSPGLPPRTRQFALFLDIDFHNDKKYEASRAGESCMPVRAEASGVDKPDEKSSGKIGKKACHGEI